MGLQLLRRKRQSETARPANIGSVSERYNTYFPRLFAYVRACVGGDIPAEDIVIQAFSRACSDPGSTDEDSFRTLLFRTARKLCRPALKRAGADRDDTLNPREREALSLVFDAGFTREQIARMFRIRESTISALLVTGLRKLKEETSPAAAAAYLKLA